MKSKIWSFGLMAFLALLVFFSGCAKESQAQSDVKDSTKITQEKGTMVKGNIVIKMDADKAPITVKNVKEYAESGFYDGTIFHRVIGTFVAQGGGFTTDMDQKETKAPIKNEASNGLSNVKGSVAMARTQVVDSATSQFYINLKDNSMLDHQDDSAQGFGYCVFGTVTEGMDVVEAIAKVETTNVGYFQDVPAVPVIITKATVDGDNLTLTVEQKAE